VALAYVVDAIRSSVFLRINLERNIVVTFESVDEIVQWLKWLLRAELFSFRYRVDQFSTGQENVWKFAKLHTGRS